MSPSVYIVAGPNGASNSDSAAAVAADTINQTLGLVPFEVFKALPKTDLHVHLDGSLRLETILELAKQQKVELPATDVEGLGTGM